MNAEKKNFYGWILLVAIGIMFLCSSGFILVGASVVNPLMMADSSMNMNATLMGLGFTLFVLCQGIPAPLIGQFITKYGQKKTFIVGGLLLIIGGLLMICFTCPHQLDLPEEIEARLVDKMMVTAEKYIPGLSEHIIIKEVLFNSDIMTASGKGGAGIGIGQVAGQTGAYRPKIKLPVEGAYVVGAAAGGAGVGTELAVNSAIEFFDNYCK